MSNILKGQILIYVFLFWIIMLEIKNGIAVFFTSLLVLCFYIYLGFSVDQSKTKAWKYLILSFIGLILFVICFIISPNQLLNKNIDSSYIWVSLDLYLVPFEWIRSFSDTIHLKYPSLILYLFEIMLLGILPLFGRFLKIRFALKSKVNQM